jgi:hypothetical protein
MEIFKDYEKKVVELLVPDILSSPELSDVFRDCELVGYEYTGNGYYLTVHHDHLPKERIACDKPIVIGEANGIVCGFVAFIESNELVLECHSWGELEVTENFRNMDVEVRPVNIESGQFVSIG